MGIADDVKYLEEMYNGAIEDCNELRRERSRLMDEKREYGGTIRRLTIELNDLKKELPHYSNWNTELMTENASLRKSKAKLESMLDLCESSCSTCKKHIEVENLKNRIKNLESKLTDRERLIENKDNKFNAALSSIHELQEGKAYWHDKYVSHIAYCLGKCPRVEPKRGL